MPDTRRAFLKGSLASMPFVIVIMPFGLLFGVAAVDAGLGVTEALAFSVVALAGAAQFAALQLMQDGAPVVITLITAIAVNLRVAMYSAALTPHLGAAPLWQRVAMAYFLVDQSFVACSMEFTRKPEQSLPEKVAFFFGAVTPVCPLWFVATWIGAAFGQAIPPGYALDFAVPIAFLAITAPMIRSRAHLAAAVVSVLVALALAWVPYSGGLLVAAALAMATGAAVELWTERRAA